VKKRKRRMGCRNVPRPAGEKKKKRGGKTDWAVSNLNLLRYRVEEGEEGRANYLQKKKGEGIEKRKKRRE